MRGKGLPHLADLVFLFSPYQVQPRAALTTLPQLQQLRRTTWSEVTELILTLNRHTQLKSNKPANPKYIEKVQRSGREAERVRGKELHALKPVKEAWLVSPKGQYMCQTEHQRSNEFASTTGCFSICLQQRIRKPSMPSLKRKRKFIKFLCKT